MIKNVVFDFGQVLIHYEPWDMTAKYLTDPEEIRLVSEVLFDRKYWDRLDWGDLPEEEMFSDVYTRLPAHLHQSAREVYLNWIYNIPEMEGMRELIAYLKETYGVKLYLLSNISEYFVKHQEEIPILKELDGCVLSAQCHLAKPDARIFRHLCDTFALLPEETVFVDDSPVNVEAAIRFGIDTFCFSGDVAALKQWLDEKLRG